MTPEELAVQQQQQRQAAALAALIATVDTGRRRTLTELGAVTEKLAAALPETLGLTLKGLREDINRQLTGLQPLEMVGAASEMSYAVKAIERCFQDLQEMSGRLTARMNELAGQVAGLKPVAELNGMVETELNARRGRQELYTKEDLDLATTAARTAGETEALARAAAAAARRAEVEQCSLAAPGDDVLGLDDAAFKARLTLAAQQREALLKEPGMTEEKLSAAPLAGLPWLPAGEFAAKLELLRAYAPPAGGRPPEPLIAGRAPAGDQKTRPLGCA